jgi:ABC-type Fe3+ transport system substrate-binding protein
MLKRRIFSLGLVIFLAGTAALQAAETRPAENPVWEKTVQAAQKESQIAVYMWRLESLDKAVQAFQKKYPEIRVTTVALRGAELATRLMTERRAEKFLWDLCICGTTTPYKVFHQGKALEPIKPALLLPEVADESKWWGGRHHYVDPEQQYIFIFVGNVMGDVVSYNTALVNPKEFTSFWDIVQSKWKGKIVAKDPRIPGSGAGNMRWIYYHPALGAPFLKRLFGEMEVTLSREERQATDWLAKGKMALCFSCGQTDIMKARQQGLPVEMLNSAAWKEGAGMNAQVNTLALMNRAPHPNAARLFTNWLLSREGQTLYQELTATSGSPSESLRVDVPKDAIPPANRRVSGVNYAMVDRAEWMEMGPVYSIITEALERSGKK